MKKWIAILAVSLLLGIAIVFFLMNSTGSENRLDEAEAVEIVLGQYGGTVEKSTVTGNEIIVEFLKEEGRYRASVDRTSGQVAAMELIEKTGPSKSLDEKQAEEIALAEVEGQIEETKYLKEQNEYEVRVAEETQISILAISAETGEIRKISAEEIVKTEPEQPEQPVSPEPTRVISSEKAVSIAQKTLNGEVQEVEFTETQDGGYYLVEIENDETEQEVTVQIHAIRGETLTVDWDD